MFEDKPEWVIDEKFAFPCVLQITSLIASSAGLTDNTGGRQITPRDSMRSQHTGGGECAHHLCLRVAFCVLKSRVALPLTPWQMDTTGRLPKHGRSRLEHGSDTHRVQVAFSVQPFFACTDDHLDLGFAVWSLIPLEQDEPFMTGSSTSVNGTQISKSLTFVRLRCFQLSAFRCSMGSRCWTSCCE